MGASGYVVHCTSPKTLYLDLERPELLRHLSPQLWDEMGGEGDVLLLRKWNSTCT